MPAEVLNAEISEVDLDSMQYSAPYLNTELQPRALVGGVSMCQPPAVLLRARRWRDVGFVVVHLLCSKEASDRVPGLEEICRYLCPAHVIVMNPIIR